MLVGGILRCVATDNEREVRKKDVPKENENFAGAEKIGCSKQLLNKVSKTERSQKKEKKKKKNKNSYAETLRGENAL